MRLVQATNGCRIAPRGFVSLGVAAFLLLLTSAACSPARREEPPAAAAAAEGDPAAAVTGPPVPVSPACLAIQNFMLAVWTTQVAREGAERPEEGVASYYSQTIDGSAQAVKDQLPDLVPAVTGRAELMKKQLRGETLSEVERTEEGEAQSKLGEAWGAACAAA